MIRKQRENYLHNTEMSVEGNYNQADDGVVNNLPPVRPDLTDGQTWDEIRDLAPGIVPEDSPFLREQLDYWRDRAELRKLADHKAHEQSGPER